MIQVKLLGPMWQFGKEIEAGEVLTLDPISAEAAVKDGHAEYVDAPDAPQGDENDKQDQTDADDQKDAADGQGTADNDAMDEEELAKLKKAIDGQYKRDELAEKAKAIGVEFAYDATKGAIIEAAVEQGKAALLLLK